MRTGRNRRSMYKYNIPTIPTPESHETIFRKKENLHACKNNNNYYYLYIQHNTHYYTCTKIHVTIKNIFSGLLFQALLLTQPVSVGAIYIYIYNITHLLAHCAHTDCDALEVLVGNLNAGQFAVEKDVHGCRRGGRGGQGGPGCSRDRANARRPLRLG